MVQRGGCPGDPPPALPRHPPGHAAPRHQDLPLQGRHRALLARLRARGGVQGGRDAVRPRVPPGGVQRHAHVQEVRLQARQGGRDRPGRRAGELQVTNWQLLNGQLAADYFTELCKNLRR